MSKYAKAPSGMGADVHRAGGQGAPSALLLPVGRAKGRYRQPDLLLYGGRLTAAACPIAELGPKSTQWGRPPQDTEAHHPDSRFNSRLRPTPSVRAPSG
jgi:hypothetical protein